MRRTARRRVVKARTTYRRNIASHVANAQRHLQAAREDLLFIADVEKDREAAKMAGVLQKVNKTLKGVVSGIKRSKSPGARLT